VVAVAVAVKAAAAAVISRHRPQHSQRLPVQIDAVQLQGLSDAAAAATVGAGRSGCRA
jgi:hypothetical protein